MGENTKVYVGNLSPAVSEADLLRLFSQAGSVSEVTVTMDPTTHRSRGFGFVTMASPELAATALRDFHGYDLGGRHITVTEARQPQERKGLMSEGFDLGRSSPFRPDARSKGRRPPARSPHWRGRGQ